MRWGAVVFFEAYPPGEAVWPKLQRVARPLLLQLTCASKVGIGRFIENHRVAFPTWHC